MRWVEDEIDRADALQRRLDMAEELLRDIVNRHLLPPYTDNKVRSYLERFGVMEGNK